MPNRAAARLLIIGLYVVFLGPAMYGRGYVVQRLLLDKAAVYRYKPVAPRRKKAKAHSAIYHSKWEGGFISIVIRLVHSYSVFNMNAFYLGYSGKSVFHKISFVFKLSRIVHVHKITSAAPRKRGAARLPPHF